MARTKKDSLHAQTSFRLPTGLMDRVRDVAVGRGCSVGEVLREAVEIGLVEMRYPDKKYRLDDQMDALDRRVAELEKKIGWRP